MNYFFCFITLILFSCSSGEGKGKKEMNDTSNKFDINKSESEWKAQLNDEQYRVLREKGTEKPFSGKFVNTTEDGIYTCTGCGTELFSSDTKFDAGCGWPSFYEAVDNGKIIEKIDSNFGMIRTEIMCAKCGGHLGHVFDDGPKPTGLRYCINSVSLDFKKDSTIKK